jgi:phosphatidylglycerophosphate synthase
MLALPLTALFPLKAAACLAVIAGVVFTRMSAANHPHAAFGPANYVTAVRALMVALIVGVIGEPPTPRLAAAAASVAVVATLLDGVDGFLARRSGMSTAFGARFDMEVDALLIMALSILAWTYDKAGVWVIASGGLRYLFVVAGWIWPWMERPLEPSRRRQAVCVIQIVALITVVLPVVTRPTSTAVAAGALAVLAVSFVVDTWWLVLNRREQVA